MPTLASMTAACAFGGTELAYIELATGLAGDERKATTLDFKTYALSGFSAFGLSLGAATDATAGRTLLAVYSADQVDAGFQPLSANLTEYAGVDPTAAGLALLDDATASDQLTTLGVSAFAKTILDDANAAEVRATIGAGTGSGTGDVVGPASSVDGHVAVFDSTTGKLLKDGGVANMANGGVITPTATPATNEIGYLGSPILTGLDSGNVAPALTDCGKTFYHTDANARNFTIPANGSIAFPVGTILAIENESGAAAVSIIITTDTLRWGSSTGTRTLAANGGCSIQKVASTVWRIRGEGIT